MFLSSSCKSSESENRKALFIELLNGTQTLAPDSELQNDSSNRPTLNNLSVQTYYLTGNTAIKESKSVFLFS
ncbi:hypothetical protein DLM78_09460 [Leptospira stimsonii]|uniref:Uncharacterized protein n=1 Tax=Leptospira stimsonii TaxID=2202203 RepID=A0A8B3CRI0_9LEPT|nr:hypothetical protein DLM78_09460 [Leptospira stimsonii]